MALNLHGPRFIADGLVRHGVDPEKVLSHGAGGLEVGHFLIIKVLIQRLSDQLPASADKGLPMANLVAPRVASKKANALVRLAKADDGLQWVALEALVNLDIDSFDFCR